MRYALALAMALVLNATANLMMKFGVRRLGEATAATEGGATGLIRLLLSNWILLAGLACFAMNVFFYTYALSAIKISIAYPIMVSGGFAIIAVVAWFALGETLTWGQWVGIAMILAGVVLVAHQMQPVKAG